MKASEQRTVIIIRPVSSDQTDFIRDFNKMNKTEILIYWKFTVQIAFKLGCGQQKTPTNRKCYANPAQ